MSPSKTFDLALPFLLLFLPITSSQQVGSFFTAIYLNGGVVSSSQTSCAEMGQSQYCCGAGASCAWDDSGKVACCPSGFNCQGSAYGSSAAAAGAGQYYTSSSTWQPSSTWQQQEQTTTVYQGGGASDCQCEGSTTNYQGGNVVPIVPVTQATVLTSYTPVTTAYAQYPTTTTVQPVEGNAVASSTGRCSNGVYSVSALLFILVFSTKTGLK